MDTAWPCFFSQGVGASGVRGTILGLCIGSQGILVKSLISHSVQCGKLLREAWRDLGTECRDLWVT